MYFPGRANGDVLKKMVLDDVQVQLRRKFKDAVELFVVLEFFGQLYIVVRTAAVYRVLFHDLIIEQQLSHLLYREKLRTHEQQQKEANDLFHVLSHSKAKIINQVNTLKTQSLKKC